MARYNHFSECPYPVIFYKDLAIGEEFRNSFKPYRNDIVCIKISENQYIEKRSKKTHSIALPDQYKVRSKNKITS